LSPASVGVVYSRAVGEKPAPSSSPGTAPNAVKIGEPLASELSRIVNAYTQQVQEMLQTCLGQLSEQWQSAYAVYADQYTKQWQDAVKALAQQTQGVEGSKPDLDAKLATSAEPLEDLSTAVLKTLSSTVEQIMEGLGKPTRGQQDSTATGDCGEAD
jgi:hypothetical protein